MITNGHNIILHPEINRADGDVVGFCGHPPLALRSDYDYNLGQSFSQKKLVDEILNLTLMVSVTMKSVMCFNRPSSVMGCSC